MIIREEGQQGLAKLVKRIHYMVMDVNFTFGGDHFVAYTDVKL